MAIHARDTIVEFIAEQLAAVEEEGSLSVLGLLHFDANHRESEIFTLKSGTPAWGNAQTMGDRIFRIAQRHAAGLIGAQQFRLDAIFGSNTETKKATRFLPFGLAGMLQFGAVAGGGMATEPPSATGMTSQGMRLLEILAQGSFAQVAHNQKTMKDLIDSLVTRLDNTEKRSDERWLALQNLLLQWQQQSLNSQLRALGIEAARKLLPLAPAAIATLTGSDKIVAQKAVEDSIFDTIVEQYSPEQLQQVVAAMPSGEAGGILTAIVADQIVRAQKRKAVRDSEKADGVRSYAQGELDAAGEAIRALRNQPSVATDDPSVKIVRALEAHAASTMSAPANGANGAHGNGHTNGHTKATAPAGEDYDLLDTVLGTIQPELAPALIQRIASDRPDLPDLADKLQARYAQVQARKV